MLKIADSIGYRPSLAARSMGTRRSGRLAVSTGVALDNHLRMLMGASEIANRAGYVMETHSVDGTVRERTVLDLASGGQ